MSDTFLIILFIGAGIGVIVETLTIAFPEKILSISRHDPKKINKVKSFKILMCLFSVYMIFVILLLFSGIHLFKIYSSIIFTISLIGWIFKPYLEKRIYLVIFESTICLILLIDINRKILLELGIF